MSGFKGKPPLKKGFYIATLTDIKSGQSRSYHGEEPKDTLVFSFELQDGSKVNRTVVASNSPKSKCMELINQLSAINPISTEIVQSTELLQAHILRLIGKPFNLSIEPSHDEKYNNIVFVAPIFNGSNYV
jgi:hypothetical protein